MTNKNILENYTGAKNAPGVWQKIISAMPEHKIFVELFAGTMAISRRKRPAFRTFGIDVNPKVCDALKKAPTFAEIYICGALYFLDQSNVFADIQRRYAPGEILIYADPPYLQETRRSSRPLYDHEFATPELHSALIERLRALDCRVMLSGYRSDLYADLLGDWRTIDIPTVVRGGAAVTETIWLNYPEPLRLHDTRFIGRNFTDRQRIKRKAARWVKNLMEMEPAERQAIFEQIGNLEKQYYGS